MINIQHSKRLHWCSPRTGFVSHILQLFAKESELRCGETAYDIIGLGSTELTLASLLLRSIKTLRLHCGLSWEKFTCFSYRKYENTAV